MLNASCNQRGARIAILMGKLFSEADCKLGTLLTIAIFTY